MSWPLVELGEICDLKNGYAFKSSDYVEKSNTLSCRMSNIRPNGVFDINYNSRYLPDNFSDIHSEFLLKDDDLVIAMTDLAGAPKILGVPTVVKTNGKNVLLNQRVGKLVIKDTGDIHVPYLKLALNWPKTRSIYKKFAGGGLQINLGKADLLSVLIPLPPLKEQKRIAAILDKADGLCRKRQQAIELADEFLRAVFLDMFGDPVLNTKEWNVYQLKDLTTKVGSGATPRGGKSAYIDEGISLIRSLNVYDNKFKYKDLAHITTEQAEGLSNVGVSSNDLLLNITGASVCRTSIVPEDVLPARVNQHVCIIRPDTEIMPVENQLTSGYLLHLFTSKGYKKKLLSIASAGGATREALTKVQVESLEIPLPPFELQQKFLAIKEVVANTTMQLQEAIEFPLFESLSQQAFAGKL